MTFKSMTLREPQSGKSRLSLTNLLAMPIFNPPDRSLEEYPLRADGNCANSHTKSCRRDDVFPRTEATRTPLPLTFDRNADSTCGMSDDKIVNACQTKTAIQEVSGPTSLPTIENPLRLLLWLCPFLSSQSYALTGGTNWSLTNFNKEGES